MNIISTSTIPFLISKAHAYHSKAPSFQNIMAMVQAKSVGEIESILQNTHYAEIVNEVVIVGANKYLELWNQVHWEEEKAISQEQAWQIIESLERH